MERPAFYVSIVWLAFLGMHGYYFLFDVWNTPHPSYLSFFRAFRVFRAKNITPIVAPVPSQDHFFNPSYRGSSLGLRLSLGLDFV